MNEISAEAKNNNTNYAFNDTDARVVMAVMDRDTIKCYFIFDGWVNINVARTQTWRRVEIAGVSAIRQNCSKRMSGDAVAQAGMSIRDVGNCRVSCCDG